MKLGCFLAICVFPILYANVGCLSKTIAYDTVLFNSLVEVVHMASSGDEDILNKHTSPLVEKILDQCISMELPIMWVRHIQRIHTFDETILRKQEFREDDLRGRMFVSRYGEYHNNSILVIITCSSPATVIIFSIDDHGNITMKLDSHIANGLDGEMYDFFPIEAYRIKKTIILSGYYVHTKKFSQFLVGFDPSLNIKMVH